MDQNGSITRLTVSEVVFLKSFDSIVRMRVAENAVDRVFVHAGWSGGRAGPWLHRL
jgi:hypothetical protein